MDSRNRVVTRQEVLNKSQDQEIDEFIIRQAFSTFPEAESKGFVGQRRRNRGGRRKRLNAVFKHNMDIKEVFLDEEDLSTQVVSLKRRAVIGRWIFLDGNDFDSASWIGKMWKPIIGYCPKFSSLINGWFCVHFMDENDVYKIISRAWVRGRSFMQLVP